MKNIVLIGFMGCGKSSVGKLISKELEYDFLDIDAIITERTNLSVPEIFNKHGEEHFRQLEKQVVSDIALHNFSVIACGGGTPIDKENMDELKQNGYIFYLDTPLETLEDRLYLLAQRPLLVNKSQCDLKKLFEHRRQYYINNDYTIDTSNKKISDIVSEIVQIYKSIQTGI